PAPIRQAFWQTAARREWHNSGSRYFNLWKGINNYHILYFVHTDAMTSIEKLGESIATELALLWAAHHAVGLKGYMCLYSLPEQVPLRSKQPGVNLWFGPDDTESIIQQILHYYNQGNLPNTPLLLNPIVHKKNKDDSYTPLGSGIMW